MGYAAAAHELVEIAALYAEEEAGFGGVVDVLGLEEEGCAYVVELGCDVVGGVHWLFLLGDVGEFGYCALVLPCDVEEAEGDEGCEGEEL